MAEDVAPTDQTDPAGAVLADPLDGDRDDPLSRSAGTSLYRRPASGSSSPAPGQALLDPVGPVGHALLTPPPPPPSDGPMPTTAPPPGGPHPQPSPFASPFAPPTDGPLAPAPLPPPLAEQPPFAAPSPFPGSAPVGPPAADPPTALGLPAQVAFSPPGAPPSAAPPPASPVPPPPPSGPVPPGAVPPGAWAAGPPPGPLASAEPPPVTSWLPPPPEAPAWVPPGARVPPGGGGAAWAPATSPLPPSPSRPAGLVALGIGVVVIVLLALVVAIGVLGRPDRPGAVEPPPAESGPEPPAEWDPRIEPIATWVAEERDLAFTHPVEVVLQTEEEYREQAAGTPADDEEATSEAADFVAVLRALGLVEGEVDLGQAGQDLASDGTLAYYDPSSETVFVRGTELTPAVRVTLAHELTHVLQDQHFDLERVSDPDFDRAEELRAIAEGDAQRMEDAYVADVLTPAEQEDYETANAADVEDSEAALADVPPVLSLLVAAPYTLGDGYLRYLEATGAEDPYDAALEDPPSQQELLDPSVTGTSRQRVVPVEVEVPEGAEVIEEDTFDPLTWYLLLASRGQAGAALEIVDGWGGDAYAAYRDGDRVCAVMEVVGDDAAATDRIYFALAGWAGEVPGGAVTVVRQGDTVEVNACDPGVETADAGAVSTDLLVVPYVRADLEASLVESGASTDQARCASTAVLGELTVEQLVDPDPGPAVIELVEDSIAACVR